MADFGITFGGNNATDIFIKTIEDDSEGGDLPGLRIGLLLTHIDGAPVRDLASGCTSAAERHAFIVEKATGATRPMELTFKEDKTRTAKKKLRMAMQMGGALKMHAAAEEGTPPPSKEAVASVNRSIAEQGTLDVNGRT